MEKFRCSSSMGRYSVKARPSQGTSLGNLVSFLFEPGISFECAFVGLAGENDWERAKVDEVLDFQKDVYNAFGPYIYNLGGLAPGNKVSDEGFNLADVTMPLTVSGRTPRRVPKKRREVPATIREAASSVKKWVLHGERRHCG